MMTMNRIMLENAGTNSVRLCLLLVAIFDWCAGGQGGSASSLVISGGCMS